MRHKSEELMKQIMDYAEQFQLLNHRSPYTSEIADALGIVKSTVYKYLVAMNDRGMLSYRNGEIVTERTNKISLLTKPAAVLGSVSCGMPQLEEGLCFVHEFTINYRIIHFVIPGDFIKLIHKIGCFSA